MKIVYRDFLRRRWVVQADSESDLWVKVWAIRVTRLPGWLISLLTKKEKPPGLAPRR